MQHGSLVVIVRPADLLTLLLPWLMVPDNENISPKETPTSFRGTTSIAWTTGTTSKH